MLDKEAGKTSSWWRTLFLVLFAGGFLFLGQKALAQEGFPSWREDAASLSFLKECVQRMTDESLPDFVPPRNRIAVFDLDGTLMMETGPTALNVLVGNERLRSLSMSVAEGTKIEELLGIQARAFGGMTVEEYIAYVRSFAQNEVPGYEGLTYDKAFFQPMLEVVEYLEEQGFTIILCSGSNRYLVRAVTEEILDLAPWQCLGTDLGLCYAFRTREETLDPYIPGEALIVLDGTISDVNYLGFKVLHLVRDLGQKPVLFFGNSEVDYPLANYVLTDNPYPSAAFFVLCDDTDRENGDPEKARVLRETCHLYGWCPVSMKDDWTTIFGPGVTKIPAEEE